MLTLGQRTALCHRLVGLAVQKVRAWRHQPLSAVDLKDRLPLQELA